MKHFAIIKSSVLWLICFQLMAQSTSPSPTLLIDRFDDPLTGESYRAIWDAIPEVRYELQQSLDLKEWTTVEGYPGEASGTYMTQTISVQTPSLFYRVRMIDEQPPVISTQIPRKDGFAVSRYSNVSVVLFDPSGIDPESITFSVGDSGNLSVDSVNLTFAENTLTYTPGSVPLGDFAETVSVTLQVADTLGNVTTHAWSFDLEVEPQIVSELLVFGSQQAQIMGQSIPNSPTAFLADPQPAIAKQAANGSWILESVEPDRLVLAYTGSVPGISAGTYLCNQAPVNVSEIFYRKVVSTSNDANERKLTLFTTDVTLEEMVQQGTLAINPNSVILKPGEQGVIQQAVVFEGIKEFDPIGFSLDGAKIGLRGRTNPSSGRFEHTGFSFNDVKVSQGLDFEWLSITGEELHWWLTPSIRADLEIKLTGLHRFEGVIRGDLETALVLAVKVLLAGSKVEVEIFDLPDDPTRSLWILIGAVGVPPLAIPVYAEIKFDLQLIAEAEALALLEFRTGIRQEAAVEMGISYLKDRNPAVEWIQDLNFAPTEIVRPEVSLNGEASLKLKLEPSVSFLVYGLAGAKASVAPRGGIVVEAELLPDPHLAGRLEADISLNFSPDGPALAWLDPKPTLSINLWEDQWHLFPDEETLLFLSQPEDTTVFEGNSVRFSASVNCSEGVAYRWFFNGIPMPNQTRSYLNLLKVNRYDQGEYFVRATVGKAYVDSTPVMLTVNSTDRPAPSGDLALIPGGPFEMGDTFSERPVHKVEVSAFSMDRYEVSKGLWDEVYGWGIDHGYSFDNPGQGKGESHPVHTVNWYDVVKWCNARSEMEGRTPAYYTSDSRNQVYRTGRLNIQNEWVSWNAGYRLPTEAEWEKAARGGLSGQRFPWGDTITHDQANYYSPSTYAYDISSTRDYHPDYDEGGWPYTSPVGSFEANGYGLYDMAGNVWEWCWDWYGSSYYGSSNANDPRGPDTGSDRVSRGGGWDHHAGYVRVANRYYFVPGFRFHDLGFRSVLPAGQP